MPLYFGFPVTCQETFRLFGLDFTKAKREIMEKYKLTKNMHMDCYFVDYANNFFKEKKIDLRVFYTDKGQCIVGYKIDDASVFQKKFITSKELICRLQNFESNFWDEIKFIDCTKNFNKVVLEHMEDEPEIIDDIYYPYIIEFNH